MSVCCRYSHPPYFWAIQKHFLYVALKQPNFGLCCNSIGFSDVSNLQNAILTLPILVFISASSPPFWSTTVESLKLLVSQFSWYPLEALPSELKLWTRTIKERVIFVTETVIEHPWNYISAKKSQNPWKLVPTN